MTHEYRIARGRVMSLIEEDARLASLLTAVRSELEGDPAHDLEHCLRVAAWTLQICEHEVAPELGIAAALLHDIVNVPKDSPERTLASEHSAALARGLLERHGFTSADAREVADAIQTHSYSRGQTPTSTLGRALCDADRLEALGAIGLFRTISTGAKMGASYFDASDPWARARSLDDRAFTVDHFLTKLLHLCETMHTDVARREATRRTHFLETALDELALELALPREPATAE